MMKRKISIFTLTILFFASTTALPVTIHLCKMAEEVETEQCLMHHKPVKSFCCETKNDDKVSFSTPNFSCCETKTVDKSIVDKYLINKSEVKSELVSTPLILNNDLFDYNSNSNKYFGYSDNSPPSLNSNYLYLTNSTLLL